MLFKIFEMYIINTLYTLYTNTIAQRMRFVYQLTQKNEKDGGKILGSPVFNTASTLTLRV